MGAPLGDRRESLRLDVSGRLWASLDWSARAILRNVSLEGALIEVSAVSGLIPGLELPADITLQLDEGPDLHGVVRHVSPAGDASEGGSYLVGLEFVNTSLAERTRLQRFVAQHTSG